MTDAFLNILHVEPCIASAAEVRDRLQSLGHHVEHVRDTATALQRFEALQQQLVIVDEAVDGDGGLSLVRRLRAAPRGSWVPVLLTAAATADHAELRRALDAGADDCLAKPLDGAVLALRVRALQRFAAVHSGLLNIVDNVHDAIVVIDARGTVSFFNAAAEAVFGYRAAEVVGRNVSLLMPPPYREQHDTYIANYLGSGDARIIGVGRQVMAMRRGGEVFPVSLAVSAVKGARNVTFIGLIRDLSVEHERERFAHMALHDPLTGLPNRAQLMGALADACGRAGESNRGFALLFIDIDRFKEINDTLGHAVGDAVLATIAGRLRHSLNRLDLVARLAGDEFVVLLHGVPDRPTAEQVAHRLQEAVAATMVFDGRPLHVSISVGVAVHGVEGRHPDELLRVADAAMYRAKARRGAL